MPRFSWVLIIFGALTMEICAQCSNTSAHSPASVVNNNVIGSIPWNNPGNAKSSDNSVAEASFLVLGTNSQYLYATGFGFSIPVDAVICGISVQIEKSQTGLLGAISDNAVYLIKGGSTHGSNQAKGGNWPNSDMVVNYGGEGDLWSGTWTAADINSSNFGVAISASISINLLKQARVDHIAITVYYSMLLPVELTDFNAYRENNDSVRVRWVTASEEASGSFSVLRSLDGDIWNVCADLHSTGTCCGGKAYQLLDFNPYPYETFYQLIYDNFNGDETYSQIAVVPPAKTDNEHLVIYPNPCVEILNVKSTWIKSKYYLSDIYGKVVMTGTLPNGAGQLDIVDLMSGSYIIRFEADGKMKSRLVVKK